MKKLVAVIVAVMMMTGCISALAAGSMTKEQAMQAALSSFPRRQGNGSGDYTYIHQKNLFQIWYGWYDMRRKRSAGKERTGGNQNEHSRGHPQHPYR